ncbi:MAG: peptidoglycan DD-metalloendopeptidase family protein [Bacteroidaceae bacterium]|nr:peptidoglycan DD-metalloendopeptidase family protein [Bacteroidaceae bacterium]
MYTRHVFKLTVILLLLLPAAPCTAQNSKKVKALKAQQTQLQKNLKKSQQDLAKTKKEVKAGRETLHHIGVQLDDRLAHIRNMENEMDSVENNISALNRDIAEKDSLLLEKKRRFARAMRFIRQFPKIKSPLLFVLSAKTFTQMYRRARYAREYATYQRDLGMQIQRKQGELMEAQNMLLAAKSRMAGIIRNVLQERRRLNQEQVAQKKVVSSLEERQKGLNSKVAQQQKELNELNKKIDALIAYEIEQARKRALEAARKKAAEEAARKKAAEEAARKKQAASSAKPAQGKTPGSSASGSAKATAPSSWLTPEERQLTGSFEANRGRLPVPITGPYMIGGRFGSYQVSGLSHVTLDNKGTDYVGQPGARARCIFDGEVTAVFQFAGTKNILIRHGSYISVYCNLSSVTVSKGQKVRTRDIIGTVMEDGNGRCPLHFQLRKETVKLNPESWIGR